MKKILSYIIGALACLAIIPKDVNSGVIDKVEQDKIKYFLYTSQNPFTPYLIKPYNNTDLGYSHFNRHNPTIFFSHGFSGSAEADCAQEIKKAYLENGDYNVILIDWKPLAVAPAYHTAVKNVPVVGQNAARVIIWLSKIKALKISEVHAIGFSLGAHVVGCIGEELARNRSEKLGRITGLDPAGPAWDKFQITTNGLDKADARFVDVIHTSTRFFGLKVATGHADFYANDGRGQPGCWTPVCSHKRAWKYYAESLVDPYAFPASKCEKWTPQVSKCSNDSNAYMGFAINENETGIFNVKTLKKSPYTDNFIPFSINSTHHRFTLKNIDQGEPIKVEQFNGENNEIVSNKIPTLRESIYTIQPRSNYNRYML